MSFLQYVIVVQKKNSETGVMEWDFDHPISEYEDEERAASIAYKMSFEQGILAMALKKKDLKIMKEKIQPKDFNEYKIPEINVMESVKYKKMVN